MKKTLITNVHIVADGDFRAGSVVIDNEGRIDQVLGYSDPQPECDVVVDGDNGMLFPGVIDEHVHFREPWAVPGAMVGGTPDWPTSAKGDMATESRIALAGGVTTVFDMPNTVPQTVTRAAVERKLQAAKGRMATNYAFYIGATNDNIDEVLRADYRQICGIKAFLGASTGGMLLNDEAALRRLFSSAPAIIAAHCEDQAIIDAATAAVRAKYSDDNLPPNVHELCRPAEACLKSTAMAAALARETGARLHVLHVSTAAELDLLDEPGPNRSITGEASPAYLWFNDSDYRSLKELLKCNPSIKTQADCQALRRAFAVGRLNTVGSDHAPHTAQEKFDHDYWNTPSGMPMVYHTLPILLEIGISDHSWNECDVAARTAEDVADFWHIPDRGHIRPGYWADLALVRTDSWSFQYGLKYKCGWTPTRYNAFHTRVVKTWVNGHLAYDYDKDIQEVYGKPVLFRV